MREVKNKEEQDKELEDGQKERRKDHQDPDPVEGNEGIDKFNL